MNNVRLTCILFLSLVISTPIFADLGGGGNSLGGVTELPDEIQSLVDNEQYDNAIEFLSKFIDAEEEKNADAWNLLGYSQRKIGLLDKSLVSYKKALKPNKKHLGTHEYIGELYLMLNGPRSAKTHLKKLSKYCGDCEQYQDLLEEIEEYEQGS